MLYRGCDLCTKWKNEVENDAYKHVELLFELFYAVVDTLGSLAYFKHHSYHA